MMLMKHSPEAGIMHVQSLVHHLGVPAQHDSMVGMIAATPLWHAERPSVQNWPETLGSQRSISTGTGNMLICRRPASEAMSAVVNKASLQHTG